MLHLTATAAAAARLGDAALPGRVLVWDEAAPARIAEAHGEIVLWFGHAAGEQLTLLDVVAACPAGRPVSFILVEPHLEAAAPDRLAWLFHHRPAAGPAFFELCARARAAREAGPDEAERALAGLQVLPTLQGALAAWAQFGHR